MLMAVGLLISGNAGATERTAGTADGLTAAVSAANDGDVIKLTSDITSSTTIEVLQKAITLDLNGYNLTYTGSDYDALYVSPGSGKTVTIDGYNDAKDKKGAISRTTTSNGGDVIYFKSGSLVIDGCNISAPNKLAMTYVLCCISPTSISVSNTTISGGRFAFTTTASPSITIGENVSIENNYTYSLQLSGETSVSMSSPLTKVCTDDVTSSFTINSGISVSTSTWALSGATTFNNNGTLEIGKDCGSYAMNINNTGTCSITGGAFKKNVAIDNTGTLTISGGEFSADLTLGASQSCIVTGGTFAVGTEDAPLAYDRIAGFIQSGYKAVSSVIGSTPAMAVVEDSYVGEATYNNTDYATLRAAVAAALANTEDNNPIVTLKKDVTLSNSELEISNTLTLNIGTFNINGSGNFSYLMISGGNVTIQGSGSIQSAASYGPIQMYGDEASLSLQGTLSVSGKYGICDFDGAKNITVASTVTISGTTYDIYMYNNCESIVNHSNANIVAKGCYIGSIISDGGGTILIQSGCKISAASYENLKDYIENGYKGFLQKDATYGDIYLVDAETQTVAAKIGDYEYLTLNAACSAAVAGDEIDLVADFSTSSSFTIKKQITIDLNGHSFEVGKNGILVYCDITIIDSSEGHTGEIINESGDYTLYINPGVNLTLLGGTYQVQSNSAKAVINFSNTIGSDPCSVIIDGENTHIIADYGTGVAMPCEVAGNVITVRNGATITAQDFCIANLGTYTDMNTTMNIESGAKLTSTTAAAIYHPGGGYLNISGDNTVIQGVETGVEIRAGELNMTGGKVTCTGSTISCNPNGNGTTTSGAGISVAQHTTTKPIIVNISGGVVSGPFALVQLNPQGNDEENYLKMKVNVTGGKFITTKSEGGSLLNGDGKFGTVTYDANAMLLSQNRRILVSGGYYKDYDPAPFVMPGYVSVLLSSITNPTPEDEQAINDGYKYKVVKITEAGSTDVSNNSGDWHKDASSVWTSTNEPDKLTQVKISGQEIVVSTPATAYGIEISNTQAGNTKLTITETGRLMVDLGGINGTTPITFDIKDGGQMAIAPAAAQETESQPEAKVTLVADWARRKATADTKEPGVLEAGDLYWQHIATPLSDGNQPTPSEKGVSYVNTWNLVNGWTSATWADVVTPFVGYQISSVKKSNENITLTFEGKLVGNHVDPMKFSRIGFSFFGNSYLAPIDIRELLTCLETRDVVDPTILLYNSEDGIYAPINRASFYIPGTIAEIKPMQGFFVFAESAANVDFDYTKAVWNSFCAKAQSGVVVPTAPKMEENPFSAIACIDIKAEDGAADRVMLFEGDELSAAEDKGYDAHKMMTSGINIYAKGSYADLAILATDNLLGSELILKTDANTNYTMSFANIKGEYALYDALTGSTINMTEGATYEFQAQAEATITDRFFVVEAAKAPTKMANIGAQAGSCKFMKQGIMFIERNNKVYNAQGQIVK